MSGRSWLGSAAAIASTVLLLMTAPAAYSKKPVPSPTPTLTPTPTPTPEVKSWNFDQDKAHQPAKGWKLVEGDWEVLPDATAPSPPNTLGLPSGRLITSLIHALNYYPITVVDDPTEYDDFTLEADFKTAGGRLDCSGGLIFRYVDQKNFYVMTAGCPSDFLALNRVTNGEVIVLKQQVSPVDKNTWYHLKLIAKEDHLAAYNGDKFMFEVTDSKIRKGRIGLWAQADAQPRFDNVKLTLPMKEIPMAAPMPAPMPAPAMPAPGMPAPAKPAAGKPAMPVPAKPVAPAKPGAAAKHIAPAPVRRPLPSLPPAPGAGASGAAMPQTPPPR